MASRRLISAAIPRGKSAIESGVGTRGDGLFIVTPAPLGLWPEVRHPGPRAATRASPKRHGSVYLRRRIAAEKSGREHGAGSGRRRRGLNEQALRQPVRNTETQIQSQACEIRGLENVQGAVGGAEDPHGRGGLLLRRPPHPARRPVDGDRSPAFIPRESSGLRTSHYLRPIASGRFTSSVTITAEHSPSSTTEENRRETSRSFKETTT